ncbi:MAG: lipopolysaccharide biosynthesis protein [Anaerolineae bacterium]
MIAQPAKTPVRNSSKFLLANSLWLLIGRGGSQALALLLTIIVARSLGDVGLGQFTVVLTLVFIGNVFSTFGLDTLLIRAVARDPAKAPLSAVLTIQIGLSFLFIAGVWLLAPVDVVGRGMRVYSLALLPLAVTTACNAILRAHERMNVYTGLQLFAAAVRLAVVAGLLFSGAGFLAIMWGLLVCQLGEALAAGFTTAQLSKSTYSWATIKNKPHTFELEQTFKAGLLLAALTLFAILYQRVAILLLAYAGDSAMTGQFSAALRLADIPRMVPYALAGALFPAMARNNGNSSERSPSGRWFLLLGATFAGLALTIWPLSAWLHQLVYGAGYAAAAGVLPIVAWSLVPFVAVLYGSFVLVARNQEQQVMLAHATALILAIGTGLIGLARWGLPGLAGALVLTEVIHALILLTLARRSLHGSS